MVEAHGSTVSEMHLARTGIDTGHRVLELYIRPLVKHVQVRDKTPVRRIAEMAHIVDVRGGRCERATEDLLQVRAI